MVICPPHPSRADFAVRVAAGRGIVSIGVHSVSPSVAARAGKALGARGRPGEELGRIEAWPGLDERIGAHRRAVGARWEEVRRVAIQADARAATRLSASLEGGRCLDVYVVPGEDFAQLDVTVLDSDDRVLVRAPSTGGERTAIVCSPVKLSLSIEIRPHAGQGLCAVIWARSDVGANGSSQRPHMCTGWHRSPIWPSSGPSAPKPSRRWGTNLPSTWDEAPPTWGAGSVFRCNSPMDASGSRSSGGARSQA